MFFHISLYHDYPYDTVDVQNKNPQLISRHYLNRLLQSFQVVQKCVNPSTAHKKCVSPPLPEDTENTSTCVAQEKLPSVESIEALAYQLGWLLDVFGHQQVGPTTLNGWLY